MYSTLLVDPPWTYTTWSGDSLPSRVSKSNGLTQYPTMSNADIAALPVGNILLPDAAVFMWATMPLLDVAIEVGKAWGLAYKTVGFSWVKVNNNAAHRWFNAPMDPNCWYTGLGYWTRANVELVLLFTQGSPKRQAKDVGQVVVAPVGRHSAKPEEAQNRIERLVAGPYAELFSRRQRPGWDCYGNEIDGRDIRDVLGAKPETNNP